MELIEGIDAEELKRIDESGRSKRIKREWIVKGYNNQLSLYGVLKRRNEGEASYCRIEVLSNRAFTKDDLHLIYDWFKGFKPFVAYTIWLYDSMQKALALVGSFKR